MGALLCSASSEVMTMAEPDKQQFGDGSDNYAQAAQKTAQAAKQVGAAAAEKTAAAGAEAGANAAAATVKAGVEGGKAVAEVAAGTAAGGPWGAILSAAWAMRHTLFKILICICLVLLFFITAIVSLPSIVFSDAYQADPTTGLSNQEDIYALYEESARAVSDCVSAGYDYALNEVERIIADGGYDYDLSMDALVNHAHASADYDICYALAAYSASMEQKGANKEDMTAKLSAVIGSMFPVTYEVRETEVLVETPAPPEGEESEGTEPEADPEPVYETIQYVVCTIHPFNEAVILTAFGIDTSAQYGEFNLTYGEVIPKMANSLKLTLYGSVSGGSVPPITDEELLAFLATLDCSSTRKEIIRTALSLVGRVPYFWGGKSAAGWNPEWNTPKLVTSDGSSSTGTIRPYGLDCSGFTDWVYKTVFGETLYAGTSNQWDATEAITEAELLPGDLGFLDEPWAVDVNHVLIYAGLDADGNKLWVHCAGGTGVVFNSPTYVKFYRRAIGFDLESDYTYQGVAGEPLYELRVNVTHYCACSKCCGSNADGITASGKRVARGMVAMSSHYPFGTKIMINGVMYTVEDRGGSGIENDTTRVDIYVPDHQEALRLGRFWTDAQIYSLGG